MSLAQQPGPGHAPDVVTRLRWALAGTALALVVVLALWVATLLAMRRAALSPPAADRTRSVGTDRMTRAPSRAPVGRSAPTGKQAAPFRQRIAKHHAAGHFGGIDQYLCPDLGAIRQGDGSGLEVVQAPGWRATAAVKH